MNRRDFICSAMCAAAAGMTATAIRAESSQPQNAPTAENLPRWRGFNLLEKFDAHHNRPFREEDFETLAQWGFDFVRLPLSYRCWADPPEWLTLREEPLKEVDEAVEMGRRHGVHVNLNLHRAPGYCVNPPKEPLDLWTDDQALEACAFHWAHLARRYKGISNRQVSFDLLNEPSDVKEEQYVRVVTRLVEAIRGEDPDRLIIADGLKWGSEPVPALAGLHIAQSTRGYSPSRISHYRASWVEGSNDWPAPTWPLAYVVKDKEGHEHEEKWDKDRLRRQEIEPWKRLQEKGVGVHVGEWGAHNRTPHDVALVWMADQLDLWKQAGWGWALWNLRGSFGVLDSGRDDVQYESFRGHKLDRPMLDLLRAS